MLFNRDEHRENPPITWVVVKAADRCWHVRTKDGVTLAYDVKTKKVAEEMKITGFLVSLYHKECLWYAGEQVNGWRPSSVERDA